MTDEFDPPLHRIHASASATRVDFGCSTYRPEPGGLTQMQKREQSRRLAVCWNVCEGFRTEDLEAGVLRDVFDAVQGVLAEVAVARGEYSGGLERELDKLAEAYVRCHKAVDRTDGRLHDCEQCLKDGK